MSGRGLARIGIMTDQRKGNDGSDARAGSAHAADRSDGFVGKKVGGQDVGDGRKRCVGKRGPERKAERSSTASR